MLMHYDNINIGILLFCYIATELDLLKDKLGTLESAVHNVAMATHTQVIIIVNIRIYHVHVTLGLKGQ